jgi:glycosyltransferase involved in cell wall biosynthesis
MTTKNDLPTVRASLDALLANTSRDDTEIVIVDAESTDGQLPVLREYAGRGLVKLIVKKCNRGEGRQIAFLESSGEYIISGVDTDDVIGPEFRRLLESYHSESEGLVLKAVNITIAPRKVVASLGGWSPDWGAEDFAFWKGAEDAGILRQSPINPYTLRVRRRHSITHTLRLLWRYADQGRTPIVSWKWEPAWAMIRATHFVATLGRRRRKPAAESPRNP